MSTVYYSTTGDMSAAHYVWCEIQSGVTVYWNGSWSSTFPPSGWASVGSFLDPAGYALTLPSGVDPSDADDGTARALVFATGVTPALGSQENGSGLAVSAGSGGGGTTDIFQLPAGVSLVPGRIARLNLEMLVAETKEFSVAAIDSNGAPYDLTTLSAHSLYFVAYDRSGKLAIQAAVTANVGDSTFDWTISSIESATNGKFRYSLRDHDAGDNALFKGELAIDFSLAPQGL